MRLIHNHRLIAYHTVVWRVNASNIYIIYFTSFFFHLHRNNIIPNECQPIVRSKNRTKFAVWQLRLTPLWTHKHYTAIVAPENYMSFNVIAIWVAHKNSVVILSSLTHNATCLHSPVFVAAAAVANANHQPNSSSDGQPSHAQTMAGVCFCG